MYWCSLDAAYKGKWGICDMSGKRHYRRRPLTGLSQEAKVKPVEVKKSRESEKHLDTNVIEP